MDLNQEIDAALADIRAEHALFFIRQALTCPELRTSLLERLEALVQWQESAARGKMAAA